MRWSLNFGIFTLFEYIGICMSLSNPLFYARFIAPDQESIPIAVILIENNIPYTKNWSNTEKRRLYRVVGFPSYGSDIYGPPRGV